MMIFEKSYIRPPNLTVHKIVQLVWSVLAIYTLVIGNYALTIWVIVGISLVGMLRSKEKEVYSARYNYRMLDQRYKASNKPPVDLYHPGDKDHLLVDIETLKKM